MSVDYFAILIASVASLLVGAVWYSKALFGKLWLESKGGNLEQTAQEKEGVRKSYAPSFLLAFLLELLTAYVLAYFLVLQEAFDFSTMLQTVFWVWLGFMVPILISPFLWGSKESKKLIWINSFHRLASLVVMGVILTLI